MSEYLVHEQAISEPPRVSIVAGCFNHAAFVADFLESVYQLDFDDWELIVVDDGSDDDTPVGQFDEHLSFEDWDMWLRVAEQFEIGYSDYVAMNYRQHSSSLINQLYDSRRSDYERSTLKLLDKWRHRHAPDRVVVVERQGMAAWSLYRHSRARAALPYLLRAAIARPTPRTVGRWMVARLGLDPARVPLQRWRARSHAAAAFRQRNPDSRNASR